MKNLPTFRQDLDTHVAAARLLRIELDNMAPHICAAVVKKYGSLRKAARELAVSPTYLSQLANSKIPMPMLTAARFLKDLEGKR